MPAQTKTRPAKRPRPQRSAATDLPAELAIDADDSGSAAAVAPDQAAAPKRLLPHQVIDPDKRYTTGQLAKLLGLAGGEIVAGITRAGVYVETWGAQLSAPNVQISGRTIRAWLLKAKPACRPSADAEPVKPVAAPAPAAPAVPEPRTAGEKLARDLEATAAQTVEDREALRRDAWAALVPLLEKGTDRSERDTAAIGEIAADLELDADTLVRLQNAVVEAERHRALLAQAETLRESALSARAKMKETEARCEREITEARKASRGAATRASKVAIAASKLELLKSRHPELFQYGTREP